MTSLPAASPGESNVTPPGRREDERVNILLVDDQPAKLLSYEVILSELGDTLIKATSAREALAHLLRTEIAVVLIDVCMPELDGFELATMIREHPRYQHVAIIFVSAIQISDLDHLRGYEAGAVDYVPVPVVPAVLRAKVRIFAELYRKTRQLERLNAELEQHVAERTAALEASTARLRESEQRRSLALAAGRMGSWDWDPVTREYSWDEGQYRLFGVDPARFVPTPESVDALIHPEDRERMRALGRHAARTGEPFDAEFRIVRPDGEIRWCVAGAATTLDAAGQRRLSGVTHDITARKRAEEALIDLNRELERRIEERTREREAALAQLFEAQKLDTIGQLTGGVAHDFNNLLMAVLGSLELLGKRLDPKDDLALRLVDNAIQGARRGAALTQRLLAFARRQELRPQTVAVAGLVEGMRGLLERALGPGVDIVTLLPADLPPIRIDANQFELALLNLAVNARDAMPLGGTITLDGSGVAEAPGLPPGSYVRIALTDTGTGMDAATLAKATEPFFTTKGPGKGTGLGLSMVQGLVAQSGGALQVSSTPGQGTTVTLWLPAAAPVEAPPPAALASADPAAIPPCTILVVDDDPLVRIGTAAMLEDLGHAVLEAPSGAEALTLLEGRTDIDLVVTDHAMPGMTGLELARRLREVCPQLPVILATGFAELPSDDEAAVPRLSKPFSQEELVMLLAAVLAPDAA
ncbi:response regulator [Methylobacterium nodulans]|uniref:histidine kinase n=1 Tax=Methylobacterium nodulans (strain LMG 21967 / CNCM I-2342 / ORS 2060) TaxID=460265 RepID=B8IBV9_METNO|nr:multi-sensor hybrid histidine kinase [Methylobacterium nodulans ORS 2060]